MKKITSLLVFILCLTISTSLMAAEEQSGEIASEATSGATSGSGARNSRTSGWSKFTAPSGWVINKGKTEVSVLSERGSEHTYKVEYEDEVEIIPGTGIKQPSTIKVQTHSRSSKGAGGGGGNMKIVVKYFYVKYK